MKMGIQKIIKIIILIKKVKFLFNNGLILMNGLGEIKKWQTDGMMRGNLLSR